MKASPVALYGQEFCIIDMHNLFVGTTLEDELLLLGDGERALPEIRRECAAFGVRLETGRRLSSYSGGEQAIICCLTLMTLLPREPLRILMVHVLETLSPRNRDMLLTRLRAALPQAGLFVLSGGKPQEVPGHA